MSSYEQSIVKATGCPPQHAAEIEEIMRHDVVHSTLDWLSPEQFAQAAVKAAALHAAERDSTDTLRTEFQRLAENPDPKALNTLLAGLEDPRTRLDAALALAELETEEAVPALRRYGDDHRPAVREAVVLALRRSYGGRVPERATVASVAQRAVLDPDEGVRLAAGEALGSYLRATNSAADHIVETYDDIERQHRQHVPAGADRDAAEALRDYFRAKHGPGDSAATKAERILLDALHDPSRSWYAAAALAVFHGDRGIQPLVDALDHPHPAVRIAAAAQLRRFPAPHASAAIGLRVVLDPDLHVRLIAAETLGVHFSIPSRAKLREQGLGPDAGIKAVSTALADIEHKRAVDPVLTASRTSTLPETPASAPMSIPTPMGITPTQGRER
jgi:HEAT repeat protein